MTTRTARIILFSVVVFQIVTHLFWLNIAAHSGQVAIPWMMNEGRTLFGDLLEQHAPGSSLLAAAAQRALPLTPVAVARLLNIILVVMTTALVYILAKRLAGGTEGAGVAAALVWAWWEPVYGNILLYFDTLLGFCILLVLVIWTGRAARGDGRLFLIGLLFGLATLFKQQAWGALALFILWMLVYQRHGRAIMIILFGACLPPLITVVIIALQGNLDNYLYWNWAFNLSGLMDGVPLTGDFFRKLLLTNIFVPAYVLSGVTVSGRRIRAQAMPSLLFLMWFVAGAVQYPRFGEIHAMGQLPLTAVMSGVALARLMVLLFAQEAGGALGQLRTLVAGMMLVISAGWMWTGVVSYVPLSIGPGRTIAHDEYQAIVEQIAAIAQTDDTLFILPQTDSTPQLHPMTGLLPPGTWIKGWHWYFEAPNVLENLQEEWEANPPSIVVVFPDLLASGEPGILLLMQIVESRYEEVARVEDVFLHGDAVIYQLEAARFARAN